MTLKIINEIINELVSTTNLATFDANKAQIEKLINFNVLNRDFKLKKIYNTWIENINLRKKHFSDDGGSLLDYQNISVELSKIYKLFEKSARSQVDNTTYITYSENNKYLDVRYAYIFNLHLRDFIEFPLTDYIITIWAFNTEGRYYTYCQYYQTFTDTDLQNIIESGIDAHGMYVSKHSSPEEIVDKIKSFHSISTGY